MSGPVSLRMIATLSDDRPSLGAKVARLLMALVALVEAMRVFQYGLPFASVGSPDYLPSWIHGESAPEFNVDAGVAILLIIPGLLLTTMEFPDRQTVLGFIRRGPRFLAYAGVLATYTLALVLASRGAENQRGWFDGTVVTLLVLLSSTLIDRVVQSNQAPCKSASANRCTEMASDVVELDWNHVPRR